MPAYSRFVAAILAGCGTLCLALPGRAQEVTEPSLKAAFIYNFASFTVWPQDVLLPNTSFVACVVGDSPVSLALDRTMKNRRLLGHPVRMAHVTPEDALRSCHLLYVSSIPGERATRLATALHGLPVLTIGDSENVTAEGWIARLFVENGKLRFELDYGAAKRCHLTLSSRLLALAGHVHDDKPTMVTR